MSWANKVDGFHASLSKPKAWFNFFADSLLGSAGLWPVIISWTIFLLTQLAMALAYQWGRLPEKFSEKLSKAVAWPY
jgi:hypothetical protein